MNFLIDEWLHTSLAEVAQARGHEATPGVTVALMWRKCNSSPCVGAGKP